MKLVDLYDMYEGMDDRGFPIQWERPPQRIVSLVPSLSETLVDLGVEDAIVGVTRFCNRPDHLRREKTRVGGTKGVKVDVIMGLRPDLVVANLEENEAQDIMELEIAGVPCWVCDVRTVERAFRLLSDLGALVGEAIRGQLLEKEVRLSWTEGRDSFAPGQGKKVAYAVWRNPWMWAGSDAYIQSVLRWWGWSPWPKERRYPERLMEDVVGAGVEEVLLASEPFPFRESHFEECGGLAARVVDGEAFSWYGSRMRYVPQHMASWPASRTD